MVSKTESRVLKVEISHPQMMAAIQPKIMDALNELADVAINAIVEALNVPVERGVAGQYVIRSLPGEPPRKDEGSLQMGADYIIEQDGDSYVLTVSFRRDPTGPDDQPHAAQVLEFGGSNQRGATVEPRPFMDIGASAWRESAAAVLQRHFGGGGE